MRTIDRIYKKLSEKPSKKQMLQAKLKQGYMPTEVDRKNLMIILKRTFKKEVNPDIGDVELLRMYLHLLYAKEVKMQEQLKAKKKQQLAKTKRTNMGSHYVKLVM